MVVFVAFSGSTELPYSSRPRQLLTWIGAMQPGLVWAIGFLACAALRPGRAYLSAALWGLLLTASFVAWGRLVRLALRDDRRLGWAFDGSVGMALTLAAFGVLACARLVSVPAILIWAAAGPLLDAGLRLRAAWAPATAPAPDEWRAATLRSPAAELLVRPPPLMYAAGIALIWTMAALHYCFSVTDATFNLWDDNMAYRSFVRQFLDTGTLYEPFSYRRVAAYGGASLLQAMVLAFTDRDRIHISDNGIALLLTVGLLTSYRAGPRRTVRAGILAAAMLLFTLTTERHNLGGQFTGVALFLALFRLFDDADFQASSARANAVVIGLLTAAVCTQRQNYMAAVAGLVVFYYLLRVAGKERPAWRAWLRQGAFAGLATVVFLLPWAVLGFINARTALYPLMGGNVNRIFGAVGRVPFKDEVNWSLWLLFRYKAIPSIALLFLAAALVPFVRRTRALHAFLIATTFAFVLMMHYFRTFADAESINRYLFAFTVAFSLAAVLRTFREGARSGRVHTALAATAFAAVAVGVHIVGARDKLLEIYQQRVDAAAQIFDRRGARNPDDVRLENLYSRLQASVPPGEPILATLDHTFYLDGRRNPIYNYDHPGVIGPRGGPPVFDGPEAFVAYLRSVGVRYIAYVFGESSPEYKRSQWQGPRSDGRQGIWLQVQARFLLNFFDTVTELSASRRVVFKEGEIRVLDLATPAAPAEPSPSPADRQSITP
jgi:hypothetical protein